MAASGQVTSGYWAALIIGVVLLLIFVRTTTAAMGRVYRARRDEAALRSTDVTFESAVGMGASLWRCQALIAEAIVVRQRLSGEIDSETYRIRMNELARQATSERRPQRNA